LRVYAHAPVRQAALDLQDNYGADVNLLLFLAWRRAEDMPPLDTAALDAITAAVAPLRDELIAPLRTLRRRWAVVGSELKSALLAAELAAERAEQDLLYREFGSPAAPAATRADDMATYLTRLGAPDPAGLAGNFRAALESAR
jgi:uncharacterized protein (TIGR02444 family)